MSEGGEAEAEEQNKVEVTSEEKRYNLRPRINVIMRSNSGISLSEYEKEEESEPQNMEKQNGKMGINQNNYSITQQVMEELKIDEVMCEYAHHLQQRKGQSGSEPMEEGGCGGRPRKFGEVDKEKMEELEKQRKEWPTQHIQFKKEAWNWYNKQIGTGQMSTSQENGKEDAAFKQTWEEAFQRKKEEEKKQEAALERYQIGDQIQWRHQLKVAYDDATRKENGTFHSSLHTERVPYILEKVCQARFYIRQNVCTRLFRDKKMVKITFPDFEEYANRVREEEEKEGENKRNQRRQTEKRRWKDEDEEEDERRAEEEKREIPRGFRNQLHQHQRTFQKNKVEEKATEANGNKRVRNELDGQIEPLAPPVEKCGKDQDGNWDPDKTQTESGKTQTESGKTQTESGQTQTESGKTQTENGKTQTETGKAHTELDKVPTSSGKIMAISVKKDESKYKQRYLKKKEECSHEKEMRDMEVKELLNLLDEEKEKSAKLAEQLKNKEIECQEIKKSWGEDINERKRDQTIIKQIQELAQSRLPKSEETQEEEEEDKKEDEEENKEEDKGGNNEEEEEDDQEDRLSIYSPTSDED
jgi:hypothetical protein